MVYATCPNCQSDVALQDPKIGQKAVCPQCSLELKIVWLLPVELDYWDESMEWKDAEHEPGNRHDPQQSASS